MVHAKNVSISYTELKTKICAILACFCLNLVVMATAVDTLNISIWVRWLLRPYYSLKKSQYFIPNLCTLAYFRLNLVAMANGIFEFYNPKNPAIYVKSSSAITKRDRAAGSVSYGKLVKDWNW